MNYAQIKNGLVDNIVVFAPGDVPEPNFMGYHAHVHVPDNLPVFIGDEYSGGVFYRDGAPVLPLDPPAEGET